VGQAGGGNGGKNSVNGYSATVNSGSGGGGTGNAPAYQGGGGSGICIVRVDSSAPLLISAGLTYSTATIGSDTVYSFTSGSGTLRVI
jgi:hypothetical protein